MSRHAAVAALCLSIALGAPRRLPAAEAEGEKTFGEWTVDAASDGYVRARTHGTTINGHVFAIIATAGACRSPVFWISWSAQGANKPTVEQIKKTGTVEVAVAAGTTTSRVKLPLVVATRLTGNITVFALTNAPVPKDLLQALDTANDVQVTIEEPKALAGNSLYPTDKFPLDGFGPASREAARRCSVMANATACADADISIRNWVGLAEGPAEARAGYLKGLELCVSTRPGLADRVDYVAVDGLEALDTLSKAMRTRWAAFLGDVLRINARLGQPASQHNLAAMYNAEPGSTLAKVFTQDYATFMYWTRKAAAQGEPRALFNLAVRLAGDRPSTDVQPDHATAYLAFLSLKPMLDQYQGLGSLRPVVDQHMGQLEKDLRPTRVGELRKTAATFSLSSLAPTGSEPPLPR